MGAPVSLGYTSSRRRRLIPSQARGFARLESTSHNNDEDVVRGALPPGLPELVDAHTQAPQESARSAELEWRPPGAHGSLRQLWASALGRRSAKFGMACNQPIEDCFKAWMNSP